jgi:hypothetical protein
MEQNTQKTRYELTNGNPIEDIVRECNEGIVDGNYVSDKNVQKVRDKPYEKGFEKGFSGFVQEQVAKCYDKHPNLERMSTFDFLKYFKGKK